MTLATASLLKAGSTASRPDGDLTIVVGGKEIAGWQDIEVTLRAEGFPNSFAIGASAKDEITAVALAGARCQVYLGGDLVITGYLDRVLQGGGPTGHTLGLVGRSRTQDLVDCSGEWPTGQRTDVDALKIATQLAQAYDIPVALGPGASAGPSVPQWLLNFGETGAEIIQRVARNAALMAYENADGTLLLAAVGTVEAKSGVRYGDNVQAWQVENSMDGRFSEIVCSRQATDSLQELGGNDFYDRATDPNVPRHRLLYAVVEPVGADDPYAYTSNKARWDLARRAGRAAVVTATLDSWRDAGGTLWTPNTVVPVEVPGNSAGSALILSEVTFRRSNETGTTADVVLMPREAFVPEPIALNPVAMADVVGPEGS